MFCRISIGKGAQAITIHKYWKILYYVFIHSVYWFISRYIMILKWLLLVDFNLKILIAMNYDNISTKIHKNY